MSNVTAAWNDFSTHISYEALVGVHVSAHAPTDNLTREPSGFQQLSLGVSVLETLLSQGETLRATGKDDERDELMAHLHQLQARLDVMTAMLDQLTGDHTPLPYAIRLNEYGCLLAAGSGLLDHIDQAAGIELRLHFDGCRAVPLILPGRHDPAHPDFVAFDALPANLSEALGKLIFRQHRLQVAASRQRG
ncbi:PilZ domain-containing protein [Frateuria aurantia]